MARDELDIVEWLVRRQRKHGAVTLGIGDDMAIVDPVGGSVLLTCDMLLDGVHFDTDRHDLADIGRKAVACSLSDCAGMAVRPVSATVSLALSPAQTTAQVETLMEGMFRMAERFDLAIVGGDTNRWSGRLAIAVNVLASPYPGLEPVLRSGALPGDLICVTGELGGSMLGRHLSFTPRVAEAQRLRSMLGSRLHAMMDLSDGLSLDLWRMCQLSGTGAVLDETWVAPAISADAHRMAENDGAPALDHALSDGEDFELLLAVDGAISLDDLPLTRVGTMTATGYSIRRRDGRTEPLEPRGFVH